MNLNDLNERLAQLECSGRVKITVPEAAEIMDCDPPFLRQALEEGRFPFGVGVRMKEGAYYINTLRFIRYMRGE